MLYSMTGYGKATCEVNNKNFTIEVKSLNSKQPDIFTRLPQLYKEKDIELRNLISSTLTRGKIDFSLQVENNDNSKKAQINSVVVQEYYQQLKELSSSHSEFKEDQFLPVIMRLPETLKFEKEELDQEEWIVVNKTVIEALDQLVSFRLQEGTALEKDINDNINKILQNLGEVSNFENDRVETIKTRIRNNFSELLQNENFDENRLEQEMIYYIEKLDINEEKVRLKTHCDYFLECINSNEPNGKKLGFISQEIGREINTLGAKANDANIQKLVVQMKDVLEKIKEQLLNVL